MLIVGPSLIILFVATLIVLFIKIMRGKKVTQDSKLIKEEHLFKRGDPELDEDYKFRKSSETNEENKNRGPEKRKDVSPLRKNNSELRRINNPESDCC